MQVPLKYFMDNIDDLEKKGGTALEIEVALKKGYMKECMDKILFGEEPKRLDHSKMSDGFSLSVYAENMCRDDKIIDIGLARQKEIERLAKKERERRYNSMD